MFGNICDCKKVYMLGIGGISMSALAKLLVSEGVAVSGCDEGKEKKIISKYNFVITKSPCVKDVATSDLVVYSGAIGENDEGRVMARALGVPCMERGALLGLISKNYRQVIAVSGSHGKTTVTAMIGHIFAMAGLEPTVHVGGMVPSFDGNLRIGGRDYFITEACEYRDSFLSLSPHVSVITSVDAEHLDYFVSLEREEASFEKFYKNTQDVCFVSRDAKHFLKRLNDGVKTYPCENIFADNISLQKNGAYSFDYVENVSRTRVNLSIFGRHNVDNALCAIMVCRHYGIDIDIICRALESFRAVESRFEMKKAEERVIVRDYAHHPREISTALDTFGEIFGENGVCFFQPHTYSRTKALMSDFVSVLSRVSPLVILPTYPAREQYDALGDSHRLYEMLKGRKGTKQEIYYIDESRIYDYISRLSPTTPLLFLGAGDIQNMAKTLWDK